MAQLPALRTLEVAGAVRVVKYLVELLVIASIYFALIKLERALAAIHPGGIAIAPAPGFALAAIILRGLRVWPAIFMAALVAQLPYLVSDVSLADAIPIVLIAIGATVAALAGGYLISVWSGGRKTFETPAQVAKFVTITLGPSGIIGATFTVGALCIIGTSCSDFLSVWVTRWLRDASGMLVIAPAIVLWATEDCRAFDYPKASFSRRWAPVTAFLAAGVLGFIAFSPLLELPVNRIALSLLAVFPVLWAAVRCSQRDTAVCTFILSLLAVWGAWPDNGVFGVTAKE